MDPLSDLTRHKAERTVGRLIEEAHRENLRFLEEHREELDELASRLLHRVGMGGEERGGGGGRGRGEGGEGEKKKKKREIYQCFTILEVIRQPFLVPNSLVTRQNVNDFSYSWLPLEPRTVTRTVFSPCEVKVGSDGRGKPMRERWGGSRGTSLTSWFIPTPSKE